MSTVMKYERPSTTPTTRPRSLFDEMEQMFEPFFGRGLMRWPFAEWPLPVSGEGLNTHFPRIDVIDRENEVLVRAELPGVEKKDIELTLSEDRLQIKASTRDEHKEEEGEVHRSEIRRGVYARGVTLPALVDTEGARASFENGLLELTLPKLRKTEKRTIPVG